MNSGRTFLHKLILGSGKRYRMKDFFRDDDFSEILSKTPWKAHRLMGEHKKSNL